METAAPLTAEQEAAVGHGGGRLLVAGGPGTGKTTTLVARYLRLIASAPASGVLVLCPDRAGADRFLDAVLAHLSGGFSALPVTHLWGYAYDLLGRHGELPRLLTGAEQREEVTNLVASQGAARWPSCAHLVGRRAFAHQVASAVLDLQSSFLTADEVEGRARAWGAGHAERWADLLGFAARYRSSLSERGLLDGAGLLVAAERALASPGVAAAESGRLSHVLVDDGHRSPAATGRLVTRLAELGAAVTVASDPDGARSGVDPWAGLARPPATTMALTAAFHGEPHRVVVSCPHPSVEPEAVAGELLAAHDQGVAWSDMAVLTRNRGGPRARGVARSLARHGIPAQPVARAPDDEPAVRAILDALRWVGGELGALERLVASPLAGLDPGEARAVRAQAAHLGVPLEAHPRLASLARLRADLVAMAAQATPAELAFEVWRRALAQLASAPGSGAPGGAGFGAGGLDAVVALVDALNRRAERHPHERLGEFLARHEEGDTAADPWRGRRSAAAGPLSEEGAVAVTSIAAAAGRRWHTVVVAGCVEGELPRTRSLPRLFDPEVLAEDGPAGDRRRRMLGDERRLFAAACSRARSRVVATAGPEPGVLLSRFVEGWEPAAVRLPLAPGPLPTAHPPTQNPVPVCPEGSLDLSATRLATYDDCPLRYAYEHGLGARGEAGVRAALGSLVHQVLATFLDPARPDVDRTREGLLALGEAVWRDDVARYRPQVEEARRDYFSMLERWWEAEGADAPLRPQVLAVERPFEVDVGGHRLRGRIDRIDRAGDGAAPAIAIVDYKTGKAEPRPDDVADDLQLAVYHLAAKRDPDLAALGQPTQLRLLYLRTMHAYDQPFGDDHEARTEARVEAIATRILGEDFEPSVDANCRLCSFHRVCPLQEEGRATGEER